MAAVRRYLSAAPSVRWWSNGTGSGEMEWCLLVALGGGVTYNGSDGGGVSTFAHIRPDRIKNCSWVVVSNTRIIPTIQPRASPSGTVSTCCPKATGRMQQCAPRLTQRQFWKRLYAGGDFTVIDEHLVNHIARWNGTSWSTLGQGLNSNVLALKTFDDGSGSALYAGGYFSSSGSIPAYGHCQMEWHDVVVT